MKKLLLLIILGFVTSCYTDDTNITTDNANTLEFNLTNSYVVSNTDNIFNTENGYEQQTFNNIKLMLTDALINNLEQSCCESQWNYARNPTTQVEINFKNIGNEMRSGFYEYDRNGVKKDFNIEIKNNIILTDNNFVSS